MNINITAEQLYQLHFIMNGVDFETEGREQVWSAKNNTCTGIRWTCLIKTESKVEIFSIYTLNNKVTHVAYQCGTHMDHLDIDNSNVTPVTVDEFIEQNTMSEKLASVVRELFVEPVKL